MDIQLPIMDGYEATRRIKADPTLKSISIIAVTSHALSGGEEHARRDVMTSWLSLIARVSCWQRSSNTFPNAFS